MKDLEQLRKRLAVLKEKEREKWNIRRLRQVDYVAADESWSAVAAEIRSVETELATEAGV